MRCVDRRESLIVLTSRARDPLDIIAEPVLEVLRDFLEILVRGYFDEKAGPPTMLRKQEVDGLDATAGAGARRDHAA